MLSIVTLLIAGLLGWLIKACMSWFIGIYTDMFYNAMAVETTFYNVIDGGLFNLTAMYKAIYTFAIALLIMFFVKKLAETYFAWSNGDPETSPFSVLIGFLKAMIIMISFGFIYETFVEIFYQMFNSMMIAGFGGTVAEQTALIGTQLNSVEKFMSVIGLFFYLLVAILCALIYFQNLGRGIELFVLRLGIPFACIGLLNADGGAFKGYFQKMIKVGFTVIVQLLLLRFVIALLCKNHILLALATGLMAYRTPGLMNEFMATSGQGYYGAKAVTKAISFKSVISKGAKK